MAININPAPLNPLAYHDMAAGVGANFLAGQQQGMQNALLEQEVARDAATRNALAGYFASPEANRPQALNELAALNPAAAADVLTLQRSQQTMQREQQREQALKEYSQAQYVLGSERPSMALQLLDADGSFRQQLHDAGVIDLADGISDEEARTIARWARDTTAPIAGIASEPDAFARKLGTVESRMSRPITDEEILALAGGGGGTTINLGDKLAEPIPITQIGNVRTPDGNAVPIGTTFQQARDMGAQVQSSAEQARRTQADAALGILGELEALALGEGGVFTDVEPGFVNRAGSALLHGLNMLTQDDPNAARYEDLSKSTLAPFIKFLGESGALADGDVQRGLGLLPRIFPLPDTRKVAEEKINGLKEIISRGIRNLNTGQRVDASIPPLPPGFVLDE